MIQPPIHHGQEQLVCTYLLHYYNNINVTYISIVDFIAKENDTFRFGLVAPSTSENEVFISRSDLYHLIQIDGGIPCNAIIPKN